METIINIVHIPFSCYGGMLSVTQTQGRHEMMIHDVRQRFGKDRAFALYVVPEDFALETARSGDIADMGLPFTTSATPSRLTVLSGGGRAEICMLGDHRLSVRAWGLHLLFAAQTEHGYGIVKNNRRYEMLYVSEYRYGMISCHQGTLEAEGPWLESRTNRGVHPIDLRHHIKVSPSGGVIELDIEIAQTEVPQDPERTPEASQEAIERAWQDFLSRMPDVPDEHRAFAQVTWYNLWSSYVRAQDVYRTDVMLMSKKFMTSVWSWDHCFNALSIAHADERMALDQFFIPFWVQNESGALPDMINPGMGIVWGVTKPPIHGWCFSKLMDRFELDRPTLERAYAFLTKWTDWWLNYRDEDEDGVPEYPQGCDSGWDNATIFDTLGRFVETADLSCFLVLQMRCLSRIAGKLGNAAAESSWLARADALLERMIAHCWNGRAFVPKLNGTHTSADGTGCLLNYMPLVLGELLPKPIADILVQDMMEKHLTPNGLATEATGSDMYEPDGYWRGPIWAPPTYLIADGLRRMGRAAEAGEIARRFVNMCAFKAHGNYENFNAITGEGLRAPGYTWTASVYLCFLWEYSMQP